MSSSERAESPMATESTDAGPVDAIAATSENTLAVETNKVEVATNGEMLTVQLLQSSLPADCQPVEEKQREISLDEADDGGDEEEDGTISDVDVSSDLDEDEEQEQLQQQNAERDGTETVENARSSTTASRNSHISQYHSIQQLSSPATGGMMQQQTAAAAAAAAAVFCGQLLDYSLHTPSEMMFRRGLAAAAAVAAARGTPFAGPEDGAADSVQMLRGMLSRQEQHMVESASSSRRRIQFDERQSDRKQKKYDDEDEEEEWARANEATTGSDDFGSFDGELGNSVGGSMNASMTSSSADEMSDGGYADEPLDVRKKSSNNNVEDEFDVHSKGRSVTDDVRDCCNPVEAKRARMESIVTSMRHSPKSATSVSDQQQPQPMGGSTSTPTSSASNPSATGSGGPADDAKRRPKRKQYIPKQHDTSTLERCIDDQLDAATEDVSLASAAKKMALDVDRAALEAELRSLNEQLNEVRQKYAHIFGSENPAWSKQQLAGFGSSDYYRKYFNAGAAEKLYSFMQTSSSSSLTNGLSKPSGVFAGVRGRGTGAESQSSPVGGDTPIDVEKLVAMLKSEIASGLGTFVEDTVKGFVEKYRLQMDGTQQRRNASGCNSSGSDLQHRRVPSTAGFCKSEPVTDRTTPANQQHREDGRSTLKTTSLCSSVENLSKDGDGDDDEVDDKAQVYHHGQQQQSQHHHQQQQQLAATTPAVSPPFPGLLLPTALRPLTNEIRGIDATTARSLNSAAVEDRHRKTIGSSSSPFFDGRQASILGSQTSTAFEIPPRSAATHHSLYPLFAPHAYYPPSRAMLSMAAAAAAAAAATGGGVFAGSTPAATAAATPSSSAAGAAQSSSTSSLFHCREPEQTEALPLVVSAPTKKKRTKVTDTRLSPRAARSMLLQESLNGSSHMSAGSTSHHHHHRHGAYSNGHVSRSSSEQLQQRHLGHRGSSASFGHRADGIKGENELDGSRISPLQRSDSYRSGCTATQPSSVSIPPLLPSSLPTSVAVPNPSLQHSDIMHAIMQFSQQRLQHQQLDAFGGMSQRYAAAAAGVASAVAVSAAGPFGAGDRFDVVKQPVSGTSQQRDDETCSDGYPGSLNGRKSDVMQMSNSNDVNYDQLIYEDGLTSTLTPMHLRKAKLMFFYVRYPSSAILKVYFPDVRFNKNNTAQLIKWFSNFREFYYIQMEKYARQALAEGVKNAADMHVSTESELYRVLVLHYNRNNQIEVPDSFRTTVQATLREFFKSIQADKDQEPSWKKAIYKIIARLDDSVPEYFKSPNWLQQLADG